MLTCEDKLNEKITCQKPTETNQHPPSQFISRIENAHRCRRPCAVGVEGRRSGPPADRSVDRWPLRAQSTSPSHNCAVGETSLRLMRLYASHALPTSNFELFYLNSTSIYKICVVISQPILGPIQIGLKLLSTYHIGCLGTNYKY